MTTALDINRFALRSLGYRTDLIFPNLDGTIEQRTHYLCIRSPHNPDYMWGNYLLFNAAAGPPDAKLWPELYRQEFPANEKFMTLAWDRAPTLATHAPLVQDFLAQGFRLEESRVLCLQTAPTPPTKFNPAVEVRILMHDHEWQDALKGHWDYLCPAPYFAAESRFAQYRFEHFRRLQRGGNGLFFGAYLAQQMVGSMGIFWDGTYARFQEVLIYPAQRRQGIARSLCYGAIAQALRAGAPKAFVTVTDPLGEAYSGYRALGFVDVETQSGLRYARHWYSPPGQELP